MARNHAQPGNGARRVFSARIAVTPRIEAIATPAEHEQTSSLCRGTPLGSRLAVKIVDVRLECRICEVAGHVSHPFRSVAPRR